MPSPFQSTAGNCLFTTPSNIRNWRGLGRYYLPSRVYKGQRPLTFPSRHLPLDEIVRLLQNRGKASHSYAKEAVPMAAQSVNKSVRRSTWLFVLFLLLGGLLHWNEYAEHPYLPSTPVYLLVFAIYAALLLCWLQSLRERLLRSAVREYVLLAGLLMLCYLIIRTFKYRVEAREALIRYLWYGYYVPIIGIPTLFLMTCICFYRTALAPSWEIALTVPAAALMVIIGNRSSFLTIILVIW